MNRNEFFPALPVTRLTLRLIGATLEMCTDDIEEIHVMVSGDDHAVGALRIQTSADQLTVEQPAASLAKSASSSTWLQVTVRLPRSWKGSIDARTVSGWVNGRSLSGADLAVDSVSGMVSLTEMSFITLSVKTITGDMKLSGIRCEKASLATTSGSVMVQSAALRVASASTVTGTVTLLFTDPFEDLTLNSVSGDLRVEAPIDVCDALLRSVSGRVRTRDVSITENAPRIRATTVSSDLDITRNDLNP